MNQLVDRATEIYCIIDDLFKYLERFFPKALPHTNRKGKRGRHSTWDASIVITLCILEFLNHSSEIKSFFRLARVPLEDAFGGWISYERYLQLRNLYVPYAALFLYILMEPLKKAGIHFIDSAPLEVCHIKRACRHKVMAGIANKSKNTKGWFFGLKLHLVVNGKQQIVACHITPANVDDRKPLGKLLRKLKGIVVADAGYVSHKLLKIFKELGLHLFTGVRNNMKKLMTGSQHRLLKSRQLVETVFSVLLTKLSHPQEVDFGWGC
jgi:IS5 family transposase